VLDIVGSYADRPFLIDSVNERVFSFRQFDQLARSLAIKLHQQDIQKGDRVAILLNNCAEFAVLYFACLYLGAVAVPINLQFHKRDIEFILGHCGAKMVIYSPSTKGLVTPALLEQDGLRSLCLLPGAERDEKHGEPNTWSIDDTPAENVDQWQPFRDVTPDDIFTITFTSGTTSLPKGVSHRIGSLLQNAVIFNEELGLGPENCFSHVLPMTYMAGFLNTLLCPFLAGASVVLSRPFDARLVLEFWNTPIKYGVNTLWLVPAILSALMFIDRNPAGLAYCREHVKTVCVGTAPLPLKLKRDFEDKYGVELFESYGLSETLFVTTNSKKTEYLPGSVGQPLPGITLKIVGESAPEVPHGEEGEIWIRTPFVTAGYLNYQTLQLDSSDLGEWFPSGDIGYLTPSGHLFITGRKKDIIIRGGVNISPRGAEDVLLGHESVAQVAVVGVPHELYGEEVVAVVRLKAGYALDDVRPALEGLCQDNLSAASVPTKFFQLDEFPVSATGKVQKAKLRELLLTKLGAQRK
jgi:acyl-CoA synthetase (AMP-forming)/AMP-acid ligase II